MKLKGEFEVGWGGMCGMSVLMFSLHQPLSVLWHCILLNMVSYVW